MVHRSSTVALSVLMVAIGAALLGQAISRGDVFSARLVLGVLFLAGGLARLYLERKRGRRA